MRKLILLFSIAAMGVGGYELIQKYAPGFLEEQLERVGIGEGSERNRSGGRISTISTGASVNLERHLDPNGTTIVDFTAPW